MTVAIEASGLGVRFRRNRRGRQNFKDLFAPAARRSRSGEFWALRDVSFTVQQGSRSASSGETARASPLCSVSSRRCCSPMRGR